ncbi:ras association domain-containing protein 2 [Bacillus rossius redtenbacheri]|uniref:ras association domain-containing protein 2 n=1 Tax=Bacillus rossius redtenbacheri TaxID=93214 RepID=UPI002FDE891E
MWKCHKCGKPVYFAERKQSLGYDWHPECLRCEECGKRLNPGQHAEHKGVPYCHVPCYGALFGPQLFGHGTRVESHTSFGKVENRCVGPNMPRSHLESKLKIFNQFYDGRSGEIRSREVNGRLVLEGALRIHWGVLGMIHLKEDDDQRTVVTVRKRNSCRSGFFNGLDLEVMDGVTSSSSTTDTGFASGASSPSRGEEQAPAPPQAPAPKCLTLPSKLDVRQIDWDELDDLLQVERKVEDGDKLYQTMPVGLASASSRASSEDSPLLQSSCDDGCRECWRQGSPVLSRSLSGPGCLEAPPRDPDDVYSSLDELSDEAERIGREEGVVVRRAAKTGSAAIRRRPGGRRRSRTKLRRRCSINGHFYDRETSFFTPPHGSQMSVWVTSLVSTPEVINLLLEKYKVDSKPSNFALFIMRDNGEQRRLRDDEYPLVVRVMLGPHEDVARLFLMDRRSTEEISSEVAQFLNLSLPECRAILDRYDDEEQREVCQVLTKFREMRKRIKQRMDELKVRL